MPLPQGPCHVCGKHKVLTYEHLPASSSYNSEPAEMFGLEQWLAQGPDGELTGGEVNERGAGAHTLCADCNSHTGGQYVSELTTWTHIGMAILRQLSADGQAPGNAVDCVLKRVRPALFLKQVVAMLASVNPPVLFEHHPELRRYVLDRDSTGLPARYQFYLALTHPNSHLSRFAGLAPLLRDGVWCVTWVTDLVWPPFAYVMTIDEPAPLFPIGNITEFSGRKHNQRIDLRIQVPLMVGEHPYPGEFTDPVHPATDRKAFPKLTSARLPFELSLASGEMRSGEVTYPSALNDWTGSDLREFGQGLLRLLCVNRNEEYRFLIRWDFGAVTLRFSSANGVVQVSGQPVPIAAVREFIGHDGEMPDRGESGYTDTLPDGAVGKS